jgi:hypothetical protein
MSRRIPLSAFAFDGRRAPHHRYDNFSYWGLVWLMNAYHLPNSILSPMSAANRVQIKTVRELWK